MVLADSAAHAPVASVALHDEGLPEVEENQRRRLARILDHGRKGGVVIRGPKTLDDIIGGALWWASPGSSGLGGRRRTSLVRRARDVKKRR